MSTPCVHARRRHGPIWSGRWIYQGFDDGRTQQLAPEQAPSAEATRLHTQVFASAGVVRIQVRQAGLDFETLLDRELADLVAKSPRVVQVWLNLADPAIERHVASLRLRGFFFGGLFPRWFGEDGILLQKVMGTPHWEGIRIYSERSKEILRFIRDDWGKCSQEGSGHE